MSAPSSYHNSPHDGRTEVEVIDAVEDVDELAPVRRGGTTFAARYPGACASCSAKITPGDCVQYGIDDQLEHLDCPDPLEVPARGVCTGCWLVLPVSGVCGVC